MPRIPAHQAEQNRQDLWTAMRQLKTFTTTRLRHGNGLSPDAIRDYCRGLEKAGFLTSEKKAVGIPRKYTLIKDVGHEAPRVRKDGTEVTQGTGREQIWRTMRMLGTFNFHTLALHATTEDHAVSEGDARKYVLLLHKAGYLKRMKEGSPGIAAEYRLIAGMNTGPQPPQIQRANAIYDPNLKKVVWDSLEGRR